MKQNYKWNADDYEKNSSTQQLWAQELIRKLNLKGNEEILDIGCGDGKITAEIASHLTTGNILGIDSSVEMIELAKKKYPDNIYKNVQFIVGDASNLLFKNKFDVVFSNAVLHWVKDHKPVLQGVFNSLKNGGFALLQMGGKGNAQDILTVLAKLLPANEWQKYFEDFNFSYAFYDTSEYKEWVDQIGFKERRIELIPKDMVYKDQAGLEGWIRTTWLPYTQRIPEEFRNKFISQIIESYLLMNHADEFGNIHVKMARLEVEIEKPKITL